MISFITGKPGGGKGLLSMQQIVDELVKGKRHVICNTPVRLVPWIFGDGRAMIGLKAYLFKTFGKDFDCDKRVHVLDDDDISSFFLWRVLDGGLKKADAEIKTSKDGDDRIMSFDTNLASQSGGVLYVIDEAWKFYGSRNWQKTGEAMLFYSSQHRHFGDDVLIVTQHTKQIDPAIQRVAQDFWVVTNHSKLSIGIFRQPDIFSVAIYDQAPTGASLTPMSRKIFRLDKQGLAQTYDTSAGVGLTGRMAADVGARRKGLPWWGILVVIALVAYLFWRLLNGAGWLVGKTVSGAAKPAAHVVQQSPAPKVSARDRDQLKRHTFDIEGSHSQLQQDVQTPLGDSPDDTNDVVCTGFAALGRDVMVFFSDGSTAYSDAGEVTQVSPHWVIAFGRRYRVIVGRSVSYADSNSFSQRDRVDPQNASSFSDSQVSDDRPVNQAIILPSVNSQASAMVPPPRLNGFSGQSSVASHFQSQQPVLQE